MAPDLNSININGRWDYSTPGSGGYNIQDIVYDVSLEIIRSLLLTLITNRTRHHGSSEC
jgi:hypothetical protein